MNEPVYPDSTRVEIPLGELEALRKENAALAKCLKYVLWWLRRQSRKGAGLPPAAHNKLVTDIEAALAARRQREES